MVASLPAQISRVVYNLFCSPKRARSLGDILICSLALPDFALECRGKVTRITCRVSSSQRQYVIRGQGRSTAPIVLSTGDKVSSGRNRSRWLSLLNMSERHVSPGKKLVGAHSTRSDRVGRGQFTCAQCTGCCARCPPLGCADSALPFAVSRSCPTLVSVNKPRWCCDMSFKRHVGLRTWNYPRRLAPVLNRSGFCLERERISCRRGDICCVRGQSASRLRPARGRLAE